MSQLLVTRIVCRDNSLLFHLRMVNVLGKVELMVILTTRIFSRSSLQGYFELHRSTTVANSKGLLSHPDPEFM